MINFYDYCNKINGEPYVRIAPPVAYRFQDYCDSKSMGNTENGNHELRPLSDDDLKRYAADDVVQHYSKMHDKNPQSLGDPMSDEEFKKFHGHTW